MAHILTHWYVLLVKRMFRTKDRNLDKQKLAHKLYHTKQNFMSQTFVINVNN